MISAPVFMNGEVDARRTWGKEPPGRILAYDRAKLKPGTALNGFQESSLVSHLEKADIIEFDIRSPKLGDALLSLAAAQALWDFCKLTRPNRLPKLFALPPCDVPLIHSSLPWSTTRTSGRSILVACRDAPEAYRADIVCNPDELPCYLELDSPTSHKTHVALPARYYLEMEMRLGVRLPRDDNFVPTYHYVAPAPFRTNLLVCYVSATSLPEKKDYGKDRYREVASALSANLVPRSVRHFHIGSHYEAASTRPPLEEIEVATIDDAGRLFATADLVIGNDTGLTHLAALSLGRGREAQVVGLYGRHSYAKWNTGRSNHHAIATVFSQWMKAADLCPVRDEIDDSVYGDAANLASIIPSYIAEVAAALLDQR